MLLQNLQLEIGKRYESEEQRRKTNRPLFSVVMDEFAPFGYRNFAQILQTPGERTPRFCFPCKACPTHGSRPRIQGRRLVGAEHNHDPAHERRGNGSVFLGGLRRSTKSARRSLSMHRWKLFGFEKYEETGRAVQSEDKETRALDEHIKNLPKGQMEILMTDDTRGTLHTLLHVRPPTDVTVPNFEPQLYPRLKTQKPGPGRKSSLQEARRTGTDSRLRAVPEQGG